MTSFFRDPQAWESLKDRLEDIFAAQHPPKEGRILRAWVAGCSTGEEAYSLAIIFREAMWKVAPKSNFSLQIFATDIQKDAIDKARQGVYPEVIAADVSPDRLSRFFVRDENSFHISKELRDMVIFAPHNLIMDPPFAKLDIVICRNLFIYLTVELQRKILALFHYCLNPGGLFFMGSAESIGSGRELFRPIDSKSKIYKRGILKSEMGDIDIPFSLKRKTYANFQKNEDVRAVTGIQPFVEQFILKHYSSAAVLISEKGDIIYISGRTGKYLEPAAGKANMNIFVMVRDAILYELPGAIQRAKRQKARVIIKDIIIDSSGEREQVIDLIVNPVTEPPELCGMFIIVFNDIRILKGGKKTDKMPYPLRKGYDAAHDISVVREELRLTREDMRTAQEELMSSNEELQSANEELQSTNEELTTSKEEMQSLNEELQTVNAELQAKLNELSRSNNDMKNLLNSTDIATLFLDNELNVRRFTTEASKIIKLIPGDVGRPVTDLSSFLIYPEMLEDAREVLRTLVFSEKKIKTHKGDCYMVRIMPYRTLDNIIDGVVITFTNYTRFLGAED